MMTISEMLTMVTHGFHNAQGYTGAGAGFVITGPPGSQGVDEAGNPVYGIQTYNPVVTYGGTYGLIVSRIDVVNAIHAGLQLYQRNPKGAFTPIPAGANTDNYYDIYLRTL